MSDSNEDQPTQDSTNILSNAILFMLSLLVLNEIIINYFSQLCIKFPIFKKYINNTILTTSLGILSGLYLMIMDSNLIIGEYRSGFSEFFLIILLPPILFESAINMEKALFFQNFGSILLYAILGTAIATFVTAILIWIVGLIGLTNYLDLNQSFAFGALISATDPVAVLGLFKSLDADKRLYILIYGESILNDAIAIIIYSICVEIEQDQVVGVKKAMEQFFLIFFISILIGFLIGIICAYILKIKQELTYETEHIEVSVTIIIPWVCYLIAQALGYSGIVSIVFCGFAMARYALPNLSDNGKLLLNKFYHVLAYNFENLVFLFIGIGMIGYQLAWKETGIALVVTAIIIVYLARFTNIRGISFILNVSRQENFITSSHQNAFWFYGLRGAMAYALALDSVDKFVDNSAGSIILTITIIIVFLNIFIQGSMLVTVMELCSGPIKQSLSIKRPIEIVQQQPEDELNQDIRSKGVFHRFKDCIEKCDEKVLQEFLIKKRDQSPVIIRRPSPVAQQQHEEKDQLKA